MCGVRWCMCAHLCLRGRAGVREHVCDLDDDIRIGHASIVHWGELDCLLNCDKELTATVFLGLSELQLIAQLAEVDGCVETHNLEEQVEIENKVLCIQS